MMDRGDADARSKSREEEYMSACIDNSLLQRFYIRWTQRNVIHALRYQ